MDEMDRLRVKIFKANQLSNDGKLCVEFTKLKSLNILPDARRDIVEGIYRDKTIKLVNLYGDKPGGGDVPDTNGGSDVDSLCDDTSVIDDYYDMNPVKNVTCEVGDAFIEYFKERRDECKKNLDNDEYWRRATINEVLPLSKQELDDVFVYDQLVHLYARKCKKSQREMRGCGGDLGGAFIYDHVTHKITGKCQKSQAKRFG